MNSRQPNVWCTPSWLTQYTPAYGTVLILILMHLTEMMLLTSLVMKFFRALGKQRLAVFVKSNWVHSIRMKSIGTPELTQIY